MISATPRDRYWFVLLIICWLGVASLLPWNVLITQAEYLSVRAHQAAANPWLAEQIVSLTANAYLLLNLLAFLVLIPLGKHVSLQTQIILPFLTSAAIVIVQAWVAYATWLSGNAVILLTVISSGLLGGGTALMTSATYAVAAYFPQIYIQSLLFGQSIAGVATALLSLVTILGSGSTRQAAPTPASVRPAAIQYFLACAAIELAGVLLFWLLPYSGFVQHWALGKGQRSEDDSPEQLRQLTQSAELEDNTLLEPAPANKVQQTRRIFKRPSAKVRVVDETESLSTVALTKRLRAAHVHVGLAFLVTLASFPGTVSMLCSVKNEARHSPCYAHPMAGRFFGNVFQPFIFLLFNMGDAIGRLLPALHANFYNSSVLFGYSGVRILIVIGIAICNVVSSKSWLLPHVLWSDFWPIFLVTLLGVSNGHLATIAFIHAPRFVSQTYRDRVGTVMSFCLTVGLTLGSLISLILLSILQH